MDGIRDIAEMHLEPFLCRLVVVRGNQENAVGAVLLRLAGQLDRRLGAVGTGAGNHRNPAVHLLRRIADHRAVLLLGERRRLAACPGDDNTVCTAGNLLFQQLAELIKVDRSVLPERGDNRNACALENSHLNLTSCDQRNPLSAITCAFPC